jgi:hypothetical protein
VQTATQAARDILGGRWNSGLSWPRVALYTIILMVALLALKRSTFAREPRVTEDFHGMTSLSLAVNRSFCGVRSGLSNDRQLGRIFFREPSTLRQTVRQVIEERWGSLDRYCATVTVPFVNNENSLMLLESWAWAVAPNLTLSGIGRLLLAIKIGFLVFFCVGFLRIGGGVLLCYAILDAAVSVFGRLQPDFGYSTYSFLPSMVLATLALYPFMLSLPGESLRRRIGVPVVAGVWTAFVANMRTSYLPVCVAVLLLYVCALLLEPRGAPARVPLRVQRAAITMVCVVAGYAAFQYWFIARNRGVSQDFSYHTVFHPLVLSVGVPVTPFSQREGITWNDNVGLVLAHRVDPSAKYLSQEYEQALATYYFSLWKRYPSEMRGVYIAKARLAGTELAATEDVPGWSVTFPRSLLKQVPSGFRLLALLVGCAALGAVLHVRSKAPALLMLAMAGTAATLLMLESIVIVPRYVLTYHASLLLLYCALTLAIIQVALSGIVYATERRSALL